MIKWIEGFGNYLYKEILKFQQIVKDRALAVKGYMRIRRQWGVLETGNLEDEADQRGGKEHLPEG
eukprot:9510492-Prorocentrum_lima.AAC.1